MRYQADDWQRGVVRTEQILLDLSNPRFAYRLLGGLDGVVQYLVEKEGVLELAAKIAAYGGLYDNERIIVWQRPGGQYVVLEGNRRVLACQILLHPGKFFFDDAKVDAVPKITKDTAARIEALEVSIVKDRKIADPVIANMHVFGKKDWHFLSQMYYAYNNYSLGIDVETICDGLNCSTKDVYYFLRCYKAIDLARQSVADNFSRIEGILGGEVEFKYFLAIVVSPLVQKHFGAPFIWDDGRENFHGHPDLIDKIGVIASHALFADDQIGYRASRGPIEQYLKYAFRRDERQMELEDVLKPAPYKPRAVVSSSSDEKPLDPSDFPADSLMAPTAPEPSASASAPSPDSENSPGAALSSSRESTPIGEGGASSEVPSAAPPKSLTQGQQKTPVREVFFERLECPIADPRLQQLTAEIVNVSKRTRRLAEFPITASFLSRALLEWSLLHQLRKFKRLGDAQARYKCGAGQYPLLGELLAFSESIDDESFLPKKLKAKCKFVREHWMNDLNCNVHNDFGNHTQHRLISMAADIRPIVRWIFSGIDDADEATQS